MIQLNDSARQRFDDYLRRLRVTLRGSSVAADEVEQSVREHIEMALAGVPAPVGAEVLTPVLDRLGPPERWIPEEERPAWRRMLDRIASGPEDWRLAYLSFTVFAVAMLLFVVGGFFLLLPAYLLSRAYVELIADRGEAMGPRRWLVYPAIIVPLVFFLMLFLVGPVVPLLAWGIDDDGFHEMWNLEPQDQPIVEQLRINVGLSAAAFGAWWIVAAAIMSLLLRPIRFLFAPLLDTIHRRHVLILAIVGAVALGLGALALYV